MEPAPLGLELSIDDAALLGRRISVDKELPYSFSDDLARGSDQGNLAMTPSADGRTQDFPKSCEQLHGSSQVNAVYGSTEGPGTARPEGQQHRYPIGGRVAMTPTHNSHHQPDLAIAQSSMSSVDDATPCYGTKAENGEQIRRLTAYAPLPSTSPFILMSQPENMEALKPLPADSPLVLRSQPEEMERKVWDFESIEALKPFPADSPLILRSQPEEMEKKV